MDISTRNLIIIVGIFLIAITIFISHFHNKKWFGAWYTWLSIVLTIVGYFVLPIIENYLITPNFQLEYQQKGKYQYLLVTTQDIEYNHEIQEEKIVNEDTKVIADITLRYRLCNLKKDSAHDVELSIFDYIVLEENGKFVAIPIENSYKILGSYSYSNNYYEFRREPNHVDYLFEEINKRFEKMDINCRAIQITKFCLEYVKNNGKSDTEIWTIGLETDYSLSELQEHEVNNCIVDSTEIASDDEIDTMEKLLDDILVVYTQYF